MSEIFEYKCPCCGGQIEFNSASQKMKCPYCDNEYEVDMLKKYDEILNKESTVEAEYENVEKAEWTEEENMNVYICKSCGGEIITDNTTAATSCPFCDNPIVLSGQLSGDIKPDFIIPFKLDKKQAKEAFNNHLKNKILLPKVFKDENHIDEIKGVYVPFWLFDGDVNGDIYYDAQKTRSWSTSNYRYTENSFYLVKRSGGISFTNVPVDGSTKMDDTLMESVEPFDFNQAVEFQSAYLAGYLADKYDVSENKSIERANDRMKKGTEEAFSKTINGYNSVRVKNSNLAISKGNVKYALYPVWLLNTTWKDQKFTFAMNGQTGKFVGNLPCDKKLAAKWFTLIAGFSSLIAFAIMYLMYFM